MKIQQFQAQFYYNIIGSSKCSMQRSSASGGAGGKVLRTSKQLLDVLLHAEWRSSWRIALHNTPLFVDQELGEVPFDIVTEKTTFAGLQKLVDGCSVVTININLIKNWILGLEAGASKLDNLLISARFLSTKLVAWESKDLKTLVLVLLIQLAQLRVVGIGQATATMTESNKIS